MGIFTTVLLVFFYESCYIFAWGMFCVTKTRGVTKNSFTKPGLGVSEGIHAVPRNNRSLVSHFVAHAFQAKIVCEYGAACITGKVC